MNIDFSAFNFWSPEEFDNLTWENFEEDIVIPEEDIVIPEEDIIVNSDIDGDILTWIEEDLDGTWLQDFWEVWNDIDSDDLVTFADVIKYLLRDEKLSTKTDVKFSFIWKSNPDYPYYVTAYEKKMIWKDLQPTKNLMCETFVVMKGLVEEWKVGTYTDIKQAYWNYAKNNWLLPSCQYWEYVTLSIINN